MLDKGRSFTEKEKTIFWNRRRVKVILLAGEVVHGSGEFDQMGQEKMIFFGQEKMIRWDRRSCI